MKKQIKTENLFEGVLNLNPRPIQRFRKPKVENSLLNAANQLQVQYAKAHESLRQEMRVWINGGRRFESAIDYTECANKPVAE